MSSTSRSQALRWCSAWLFASGMLVLAFGCSGKSERSGGDESNDDGASGTSTSGSGGTASGGVGATTGGSSGKGGTSSGGAGGSGDAGGVGGTAAGGTATGGTATGGTATGGTATGGEGGIAGAGGAECESAADCVMVSDCCGCRAEPADGETFCALPCVRDACAEDGIETNEVECVHGQCVISRSCDRGRVTCREAQPECPSGTVPSVTAENCWGPCIAPTDCARVTDCSDCSGGICVSLEAQRPSYSCRAPVNGCNAGSYCECLGACTYCVEREDRVSCACPTC